MTSLVSMFHWLIPLIYFAIWACYLWLFWTDSSMAHRLCTRLALAVVLIHVICMIVKSFALHRLPIGAPLEFSSALALALLATYLVIEIRIGVKNTGFVVTGTAFLLVLIANLFGTPVPETSPLLKDPGFAGHVILVLLAYTALSLSFLYALLYLVLARQLTRHQFGRLFRRLPSLDTLERMSVGAVKLSVPILFLALCLGHLWMYDLRDRVSPEMAAQLSPFDPKILMAWFILLIYVVGLMGNRFLGWRGRRMNVMAVIAYVTLVAATGVAHHIFPGSFHNFKSTRLPVSSSTSEDTALAVSRPIDSLEGRR